MALTFDMGIDTKDIDRAIAALGSAEASTVFPEFEEASKKTVKSVVGDLKRGVARHSGQLRNEITGLVQGVQGTEVSSMVSSGAENDSYNYGARLDKDGGMKWRSGKFSGRRTFGWFTSTLKRNAPKVARTHFKKAVENIVVRMSKEIG